MRVTATCMELGHDPPSFDSDCESEWKKFATAWVNLSSVTFVFGGVEFGVFGKSQGIGKPLLGNHGGENRLRRNFRIKSQVFRQLLGEAAGFEGTRSLFQGLHQGP